jgi:hypothetical protein
MWGRLRETVRQEIEEQISFSDDATDEAEAYTIGDQT